MYRAHTKAWGSEFDLALKKVKHQRRTIIFAILVDLLSLFLCAKIRHRAYLVLRRRFFKGFYIYRHGSHLGQWIKTILAIFRSPAPRRLHMKFEQHWPRGFRAEVIWNYQHFIHMNVWGPIQINAFRGKLNLTIKRSNINLATLVDSHPR